MPQYESIAAKWTFFFNIVNMLLFFSLVTLGKGFELLSEVLDIFIRI